MNGKQILITSECHEVLVVRRDRERIVDAFCLECCELVEMVNFDTAISISGIGGRELVRRSGSGQVHVIQAASGHLFVCVRSLKG